ncbi:hypothetical protein LCGC14_1200710 [marine sediment metagenome]|uniref:Uncharacterized protein n=1 Tax=marine sediment metagenome TaxID=412755 RepID=A0A0F9EPN5_9ZZZZ
MYKKFIEKQKERQEIRELKTRASKCFTNPEDALIAFEELKKRLKKEEKKRNEPS